MHDVEVPAHKTCVTRLLSKFTAASLVLSLAYLSPASPLLGQQGSTSQPTPARTASIPAASPAQTAKARDLFLKGTVALKARKSTRALKFFAAAHKLDPGNGGYVAAYEIARQQQIGGLIQMSNADEKLGESVQAKQKLAAALTVDPGNPYVQEHLRSLASEEEPAVVQSIPMPQFSSGLVEVAPTQLRATFHLNENQQQVIQQIFRAYGITALLDDSVPTKAVRIDLTSSDFNEASNALQLATDTFIVPLDSQHVLVAKDTKENRSKFQRLLLETVFLPGVDAKDMNEPVNMLKNVFGVRQVSVRADTATMSIRAPEETLRAINTTLARLYLDKPEVMLDVRIYQINDSRMQDLGVAFPQSLDVFNASSELTSIISQNQSTVAELISSGLVNPGDLEGIAALLVGLGLVNGTVFNQPFALFGNGLTLSGLSFGSTTVNASLNISNMHELDHVQLRASDWEKESFLVGSRYPVVTQSYSAGTQTPTSYTSLASLLTGSATSNVSASINPLAEAPTVQYQNLGLTLETNAHVVENNDVQMKLQVKIAALSGSTVNGSPIINNRSFTTTIQIPDGGSALVTSSVSRSETRALTGIPGLSELPGFAWTASPSTDVMVGKLLIVVSPHIVSATHSSIATQMLPLLPDTAAE